VLTSAVTVSNWCGSGYTILASRTPVTSCSTSGTNGTGVVPFTPSGSAAIATLPAGTWYVHRWRDTTCNGWGANPLTVTGLTSYSADFNAGTVTSP
jgi:hypothetical protein